MIYMRNMAVLIGQHLQHRIDTVYMHLILGAIMIMMRVMKLRIIVVHMSMIHVQLQSQLQLRHIRYICNQYSQRWTPDSIYTQTVMRCTLLLIARVNETIMPGTHVKVYPCFVRLLVACGIFPPLLVSIFSLAFCVQQ